MKTPLRIAIAVGSALLAIAAVLLVYRQAAFAYFLEDDFHWFAGARRFEWAHLVQLDRYDHFYRPVIEIYFFLGQRLFGCAPLPFHLASLGIHLLNTGVLFLLARQITRNVLFASLAVVLFVVQPGYTEAVAWVAAITDLLPAFWYLLTLLLHVVFLQTRRWWAYGAALATFTACLLTHESSATLLPMMIALEMLLFLEGIAARGGARRIPSPESRASDPEPGASSPERTSALLGRYAPFAGLLALFLVVAYVVNSRSYLVRDGHYAFGLHAVPNAFHYLVALYVGTRSIVDYLLIAVALAAVLIRGTHRMRFWVFWIFATLLPCLFFTWGIAARYLYVPAAGFALLLADLMCAAVAASTRWMSPRALRSVAVAVALVLAARFAVFAQQGAEDFAERTVPYQRIVAAIAEGNPALPIDGTVSVERRLAEPVPEIYRDPVAETAVCAADIRLVLR